MYKSRLRDNGGKGDKDAIKPLNLDPQAKRGNQNMLTSHRQGTAHNPHAPGAATDAQVTDGIDYIRNIWHKNTQPDAEKLAAVRNGAGS